MEALKDQWQAFRAEWGYHLFFWLFLSLLAALIAVSRPFVDESNPNDASSRFFKFPAEAADKQPYGKRTFGKYLSV